ncbi:hypothetical protein [Flavobacterium nitrogenifigens]|uniref:Lipoprotein n=1 Tax=Flavobacterium nitrogenifigens TaxID=1617283 RepID=A0A521CT20_9FLAO|nr:hypothetical protein [Flavobacterium nitrogenifigens]KAF2328354.1 hypothetical protein DM397_17420 [Flavobacterium nitrogenifigens]SMO62613.1 hypothetical protein SAMN06265220_102591 [Flavobacterium nitrogenifigens]
MKLSKFIFITLVLFSSFGCKKKEVSESDFEKDVLNSVFLEIVDSIYMDRRIMYPPPMPKIDFKTNKKDTIGYHDKLKRYQIEQDSIKNDKNKILIGVHDFIISNRVNDEKFDLTPFKKNKKFDFQHTSKFPEEIYWDINDKKSKMPVGTIKIHKIHFNKTKTSGILEASASCGGGKCGRGFEITIENKSGKWHISKIIDTWIS